MTASPNRPYLPAIDQLRGGAFLLVLFYHGFQLIGARLGYGVPFDPTKHWVIARNPLIAVIEEGHSGVALFIVLSGFILSLGAIDREVAYGRFILARVLRIYPTLMLCLMASAAGHTPTLLGLLATVIPFHTTDIISTPLTGMFWAVGVEFLCYLLFPFLIRFSTSGGSKFLVGAVGVTVIARCLAVFGDGANPQDVSYWSIVGRLDQFCIGMLAARLYVLHDWRERLPSWSIFPASGLIVISLVLFNHAGGWPAVRVWKLFWPTFEAAIWALFMLAYVRSDRLLTSRVAALLTWIGAASYPLYIFHFGVLNGCIEHRLMLRLTTLPYYDALLTTALIVLPISLAVGIPVRHVVEVPLLKLRRRYIALPVSSETSGKRS